MHELFSSRSFTTSSALEACQSYLDRHWRGFRLTRRLLPGELRDDLIALFAWHAVVRDRVRLAGSEEELTRSLEELYSTVEGAFSREPATPLSNALRKTVRDRGLDREFFLNPLEEYGRFESVHTFETRTLLTRRAQRISSPEGRLLVEVFGLEGERCQLLADTLGLALTLTMWLDNFGGDFARGRLHFAMEDLARHGVQIGTLQREVENASTRSLVRSQIAWARELFERGWPLCSELGVIRGRLLAGTLRWHAARLSAREAGGCNLFSPPSRAGFPRLLACGVASLGGRRAPRLR